DDLEEDLDVQDDADPQGEDDGLVVPQDGTAPDVPDDVADGPVVVPEGPEDTTSAAAEDTSAVPSEPAADEPPKGAGEGSRRRSKGRPSVPSWDDIMFGAADRKR
ncbi:MAG TPA: hypothetical protein VLO09_06075, partial [Ornithinimicrobium sp.]|nr:hypothetical protein [Ornithinimicrobium sp.]